MDKLYTTQKTYCTDCGLMCLVDVKLFFNSSGGLSRKSMEEIQSFEKRKESICQRMSKKLMTKELKG